MTDDITDIDSTDTDTDDRDDRDDDDGAGAAGTPDGTDTDDGVERGELIGPDGEVKPGELERSEAVTEPAKVMRIGSMIKQLLEEVRQAPLDHASRERLAEIYERSIVEITEALSPDLQEELRMLALPFDEDEVPSDAELRIAKAQLVGWLEGLFHGIQASLMAQQMAARQQLDQMRQLNAGQPGQPGQPGMQPHGKNERPGTYL